MKAPEFNRIYLGKCEEVAKTWPDNFVDAVCTDPPYGLGKEPDVRKLLQDWLDHGYHAVKGSGFMGNEWDAFVPQPAQWSEIYRVMKPGAHLLAFAGTRTYDWMVLSLRLAGFEVRDQAQCLYGQGFPKSLNVSMQLDKMDSVETRRERALRFTAWMRASGITARQVNDLTDSNMASHYLTAKEQPEVATADMFDKLRSALPAVPEEIEELVRWRTVESENFKRRKVTGTKTAIDTTKVRIGVAHREEDGTPVRGSREIKLTEAHTELAKKWDGWGTALKPANEPIVLARKPLDGTVADNVMRWGTGALNIDACRIPAGEDYEDKCASVVGLASKASDRVFGDFKAKREDSAHEGGRWPANLIVMHHPACVEAAPPVWACVPTCPMRMLEAQTPGSSKFFYVPKPDGGERNRGLEGAPLAQRDESREAGKAGGDNLRNRGAEAVANFHPTVKPVDLMAYLVKLVTPPGGVVLDPFMGSGTTAIAAARLGYNWLGVERDADYLPMAEKRIAAETEQGRLL